MAEQRDNSEKIKKIAEQRAKAFENEIKKYEMRHSKEVEPEKKEPVKRRKFSFKRDKSKANENVLDEIEVLEGNFSSIPNLKEPTNTEGSVTEESDLLEGVVPEEIVTFSNNSENSYIEAEGSNEKILVESNIELDSDNPENYILKSDKLIEEVEPNISEKEKSEISLEFSITSLDENNIEPTIPKDILVLSNDVENHFFESSTVDTVGDELTINLDSTIEPDKSEDIVQFQISEEGEVTGDLDNIELIPGDSHISLMKSIESEVTLEPLQKEDSEFESNIVYDTAHDVLKSTLDVEGEIPQDLLNIEPESSYGADLNSGIRDNDSKPDIEETVENLIEKSLLDNVIDNKVMSELAADNNPTVEHEEERDRGIAERVNDIIETPNDLLSEELPRNTFENQIKESNDYHTSEDIERIERAKKWLESRDGNTSNKKNNKIIKDVKKSNGKKEEVKKGFLTGIFNKKVEKKESVNKRGLFSFFTQKNKAVSLSNDFQSLFVLKDDNSVDESRDKLSLDPSLQDSSADTVRVSLSTEEVEVSESTEFQSEIFTADIDSKNISELKEEIKNARLRARLAERDLDIARKEAAKNKKIADRAAKKNREELSDEVQVEFTQVTEIEEDRSEKLNRAAELVAKKKKEVKPNKRAKAKEEIKHDFKVESNTKSKGNSSSIFGRFRKKERDLDRDGSVSSIFKKSEDTQEEIISQNLRDDQVVISKELLEKSVFINKDEVVLKREDLEKLKEEFDKKESLIKDLQDSDKFGKSEIDEEEGSKIKEEGNFSAQDLINNLDDMRESTNNIESSKLNELLAGLNLGTSESENDLSDSVIKPLLNPIVTYSEDGVELSNLSVIEEMGDISISEVAPESVDERKLAKFKARRDKKAQSEERKIAKHNERKLKKAEKKKGWFEKRDLSFAKKEKDAEAKLKKNSDMDLSREEKRARAAAEKIAKKELIRVKKEEKKSNSLIKKMEASEKKLLTKDQKKILREERAAEKRAAATEKKELASRVKNEKSLEKEEKKETKNVIQAEKLQKKLEIASIKESKKLEKKLIKQDKKENARHEKNKIKNAKKNIENEGQSVKSQRKEIIRNEKKAEKLAKQQSKDMERRLKIELKSAQRAEKITRQGKEASMLSNLLSENRSADKEAERIRKKTEGIHVPVYDIAAVSLNPTAPASYSWDIEVGVGNSSELNHVEFDLPEPLPRR